LPFLCVVIGFRQVVKFFQLFSLSALVVALGIAFAIVFVSSSRAMTARDSRNRNNCICLGSPRPSCRPAPPPIRPLRPSAECNLANSRNYAKPKKWHANLA